MDKEDIVHIANGILISHKKEQNNAICSNMNAPGDYHKWSKHEKDKYHMILLYAESIKMIKMNLFIKQSTT